ncbi:MAG: patatin-like phospholipase family protein [Gemmatimonadales bacterium]
MRVMRLKRFPLLHFFIFLFTLAAPVTPLRAQASCEGPLALVLSGGGAKGLAHLGVLQVLDSLGIRPDLVVGTSMGSIVGAMYASGYSPSQIAEQAADLRLADLFSRRLSTPHSLGQRRPLVVWERGAGGVRTAESGPREAGVNGALDRVLLRGNLQARGNFDSLPIPFRAVATDIRTRSVVVLSGGDLAQAVRASMAIPLVFDPERIEGRDLVDGGLASNVPIATARRAGATRVIVSDVGWRPPDSVRTTNPLAIADLLIAYLFSQPLDSLGPEDRIVRPAIDSFNALDFTPERMQELIDRGYRAAREAFEAQPPACAGRPVPPPPDRRIPDYRVATVRVEGVGPGDQLLIRRALGLDNDGNLDVSLLRDRLRTMGENADYRAIWLRPSGPPDSLSLSLLARAAPSRMAAAGLAYDNDLGGQMWLGGIDRGTVFSGLEASATLSLAELRQEVAIGFRREVLGPFIRRPFLNAFAARESVRRFDTNGDPSGSERTREARAVIGLERRLGREWRLSGGGLAHAWDAPGANRTNGLGGFVALSSGPQYRNSGLWGEAAFTTAYTRVAVEARKAVPLAGFRITPGLRFGYGRHLPLMSTFMLGGSEGFPGLNIGEFRGDRELHASVTVAHTLLGPVEARFTAASGKTAVGGPTFPAGRWQAGGRFGLAAETPIGPIRVEYGVAHPDRNGFFVRLGDWF